MEDLLYRGIIDQLNIRFVLADCQQTVNDIILKHDCDPVSSAIFANAISSAALVSSLLTEDEKYTLKWRNDGQLGLVMADCDAQGHVRALISNPHLAYSAKEEADIWGKEGSVSVIKSSTTQILNSGTVEANFRDLAQDLAFFFSVSDQIETAIVCKNVFNADPSRPIRTARAVMLQALPGCDLTVFEQVRNKLESDECKQLLTPPVVTDNLFEIIVKYLADGIVEKPTFSMEHSVSPQFKCNCTKENMIAAAASLSKAELDEAFKKDGELRITCQFCNTTHVLKPEDMPEQK